MSASDTIYALASGSARAALAVFRVSGPDAGALLETLCAEKPAPRRAVLKTLADGAGQPIDRALVLWFPAPASFTGEDVAEFHVHGGPAVLGALAARLSALGARAGAPGEFTRRAFENGKLDLTQAEAIADLVDAETEAQRAQALRQLGGALGALYEGWRAKLVEASAWLEAEIDFPDEGDVPGGVSARARPVLQALAEEIAAHLDDGARGERVREGFRIAIIGAPNVGKSSLLNRLARRDAAIVTDISGTTRDVVEARLSLAGQLALIADTAGLRETDDVVEREGVRRARLAAEDADLRIGVMDAAAPESLSAALEPLRPDDLLWVNKADLAAPEPALSAAPSHVERLAGSAETGDGLDALEARLAAVISERLAASEAPSLTRERHRAALSEAQSALIRAIAQPAPELAAEDARLAARALGAITGRVDVEDILDRIFRDFCIGK